MLLIMSKDIEKHGPKISQPYILNFGIKTTAKIILLDIQKRILEIINLHIQEFGRSNT